MTTKNTEKTIAITEVKALEMALAMKEVKANKELKEKFERMLEVRVNKSNKRTETPKQKENKAIAEKVIELLSTSEPMTAGEVAEIIKEGEWKEPINTPRITRILTNLKEEGRVTHFKERKVSLYKV